MRYIKLYEAFESDKLSKTLKFITDKNSSNTFRNELAEIAETTNFPMSKYSDDMFTYLPFKKALSLNAPESSSRCKFESSSIKGEYCNKGRIKRKWGEGTRIVECPNCSGTGIDRNIKPPIKYIKFWFTQDGKFVTTTASDGLKRPAHGSVSPDLIHYKRGETIMNSDYKSIPVGTKLIVDIDGTPTLCYLYEYNSRYYLIQNYHDGDKPYNDEWRKYGTRSWSISADGRNLGKISYALSKSDDVDKEEYDPYEFNGILNSRRMNITPSANVEDLLSRAHFALILDYEKISNGVYKSTLDIRSDRRVSRDGALRLKDNESIKQENINRYIQKIGDSIDISGDISNIKTQIIRVLGWNFAGLNILYGKNVDNVSNITQYLHSSMLAKSDSDKKTYIRYAIDTIKNTIKRNNDRNKKLRLIINKAEISLKEKDKYVKDFYDKVMSLNSIIIKKINDYKIENIHDLELLLIKIRNIKQIYQDGRVGVDDDLYYFLGYLSSESLMSFLEQRNTKEELKRISDKIDKFIYMVDRV